MTSYVRLGGRIRSLHIIGSVLLLGALVSPSVIAPPDAEASFPGVNGRIYFEQGKNIYYTPASGGSKKLVVRGNDLPANPNLDDVSVSPSGQKIAFSTQSEIWVGNFITGKTRAITDDVSDDLTLTHLEYPAWSPDGKRLVFQAVRQAKARLYRINADGTGIKQLVKFDDFWDQYDMNPDWSAVNNKIVFENIYDLWTINPDGTQATNLTDDDLGYEEPTWSPDTNQIAADHDHNGDVTENPGIVVLDGTSGEVLWEVTGNSGAETEFDSPSWSPDGDWLAFDGHDEADDGHNHDIYKVPSGGGEMVRLETVSNLSTADSTNPAWGVKPVN